METALFQTTVALPDYARENARGWQTLLVATMLFLICVPVWCCAGGGGSSGGGGGTTTSSSRSKKSKTHNASLLPTKLVGGLVLGILGWTASLTYYTLHYNAYNTFATKRVFVAPVLTPTEAHALVRMASQVAQVNFRSALMMEDNHHPSLSSSAAAVRAEMVQEPVGWHKVQAPAAYLHLDVDPFSTVNQTVVQQLLDRRLAPLLQQIYGLQDDTGGASWQANDLYLVYYRAHQGQQPPYSDMGDITFQITLYAGGEEDDDDEPSDSGTTTTVGGTRFVGQGYEAPLASKVGYAMVYPASLPREELPGTNMRILLLGNLQIPPSAQHWLQSVGNVAWIWNRLQYSSTTWTKKLVDSLITPYLQNWLETTPLRIETLVAPAPTAPYWQEVSGGTTPDDDASSSSSQWWSRRRRPSTSTSTTSNARPITQSSTPPVTQEL